MPANTVLYDIAKSILSAIETAYTNNGISLPTRRFVHQGEVAFDCDQIAVTILAVNQGLPGFEITSPVRCGLPLFARLQAVIIDCVPGLEESGQSPGHIKLDNAAKNLATKGWVALTGIRDAHRANKITSCDQLRTVSMTAIGPEGGVAGWVIELEAQVT